MTRPRVAVAWSSGKDAAWTLHLLRGSGEADVVALLTTVVPAHDRVAMHGVRTTVLRAQAAAAGLPLLEVPLPAPCSNAEYDAAMAAACARLHAEAGVSEIAFGDLFLEDVRAYREARLAGSPVAPRFPLWGRDTTALAREMQAGGLAAQVVCVDPRVLDPAWAGAAWDAAFVAALPAGADPCGERGEFHTLVTAGPMFSAPLEVVGGDVVTRDGFVYADVALAAGPPPAGASPGARV